MVTIKQGESDARGLTGSIVKLHAETTYTSVTWRGNPPL